MRWTVYEMRRWFAERTTTIFASLQVDAAIKYSLATVFPEDSSCRQFPILHPH